MDIWSHGFRRDESLVKLMERARTCGLCKIMADCVERSGGGTRDAATFYRSGSSLKSNLSGSPILSIYVLPGSRKSPTFAQIGLPRLPEAGSPTHFKLIREWLRVCDDTHQCRPTNSFLPTRVVDVGKDNASSPVRLYSSKQGEAERYAALSHRWEARNELETFCLFRSNIEELHSNIDFNKLPKTFQDAIIVTRALDIQFLWIDSLCIIQDDSEDWAAEAKLMEDVFSSAYCTIAASPKAGDGFLRPRPPRQFITIPTGSDGRYYICEAIDDFRGDVEESELNKRGWVLQERALSHRSIYFTTKQAYWECGKGIQSETLSRLLNSKAAFLGDPDFPKSSLKYLKGGRIRLFEILYERYSNLEFTVKTDRAVAIIGLEKRLLKAFGTRGGFGILDLYLHRSLLWQRFGNSVMKRLCYPTDQPVPSWSWMASDGAICYLDIPLGKADWNLDISSPFSVEHYGSSEHCWHIGKNYPRLELRALAGKFNLTRSNALKRLIIFDTDAGTDFQDLRWVMIGKEKSAFADERQKHYVLVVRPTPSKGSNAFERVGVGAIEKMHISFEELEQDVRIL